MMCRRLASCRTDYPVSCHSDTHTLIKDESDVPRFPGSKQNAIGLIGFHPEECAH